MKWQFESFWLNEFRSKSSGYWLALWVMSHFLTFLYPMYYKPFFDLSFWIISTYHVTTTAILLIPWSAIRIEICSGSRVRISCFSPLKSWLHFLMRCLWCSSFDHLIHDSIYRFLCPVRVPLSDPHDLCTDTFQVSICKVFYPLSLFFVVLGNRSIVGWVRYTAVFSI